MWAADTVSRQRPQQRLEPDPDRAEMIMASVTRIVGALDTADLDAALLLYPLRTSPRHSGSSWTHWLGLCVPEDMLERPRQRSVVETPAGTAVRLVQRYGQPLSPDAAEIRDHVAYGWLVADHAQTSVVVASTTFVDLVAAGTWITAIDELARSATR